MQDIIQQVVDQQIEDANIKQTSAPDSVPFWQPERGKNESFGDYRDRRRSANEVAKNLVKRGVSVS
jgi:hypothetical protein